MFEVRLTEHSQRRRKCDLRLAVRPSSLIHGDLRRFPIRAIQDDQVQHRVAALTQQPFSDRSGVAGPSNGGRRSLAHHVRALGASAECQIPQLVVSLTRPMVPCQFFF